MRSQGVPEAQINARTTVDASFSTPARGSVAQARAAVPRTRTGRGQGRNIECSEQSRQIYFVCPKLESGESGLDRESVRVINASKMLVDVRGGEPVPVVSQEDG
jgi:hypothetical protein